MPASCAVVVVRVAMSAVTLLLLGIWAGNIDVRLECDQSIVVNEILKDFRVMWGLTRD